MLVFGYSFGENPTTLVKEELNVLKFSDCMKVTKKDNVVIFGVEYNGDDSFSLDNVATICERAKNIIYISSASVYATKLLFPYKENDTLASNTIEGTINEVLEEIVLATTFDFNNNACILRVDTIEDSALLDLIEAKAQRGLYGSLFNRMSVITLERLFLVTERVFRNMKPHASEIYNIAEKSMSEHSYYSKLSPLPVSHKIKFGNSALNTDKAKKVGLL